jgi:hypothetical protein
VNKNLLIIGAVILLIVLGAAGYFLMNKSQAPSQTESSTSVPQEQNTSAFSTIKDALSRSLSLQCDFTNEEGIQTTAYIKNGAVRSDMTSSTPGQSGHMIMKDNTFYSWQDGKTDGIMMKFSPEDLDSAQQQATQGVNPQESLDTMEKYKESCKTANVSDSVFTPPSEVKFQDMSEMMKMMPTGGGTAPSIDPSKIQEMMDQYQNPQQ